MESNPFGLPFRDPGTWGILPETYYREIGCDQSRFGHDNDAFWECIRAVDVDTIVSVQWKLQNSVAMEAPDHFWNIFLPWAPTVGTDLFEEQAYFKFQKGEVADIPYIIGVVRDEALEFVWGAFPEPIGKLETDALIDVLLDPSLSKQVKEQYPYPTNTSDYRYWASQVVTDGLFRCPSYNSSEEQQALYVKGKKQNPSWFYHFDHISSFNVPFWGPAYSECYTAVCHAAELPYVFHPNPSVDNTNFTTDELYLMMHVASYWTEFAANQVPGSGYSGAPPNNAGVQWTQFENEQTTMLFDTGVLQVGANWDSQFCDFWDASGYPWIK
jgi:acetylcholinesterase/cholinesterase